MGDDVSNFVRNLNHQHGWLKDIGLKPWPARSCILGLNVGGVLGKAIMRNFAWFFCLVIAGVPKGHADHGSAGATPYTQEPIQPIAIPSTYSALERAKIALGRKLFADSRLSSNNQFACANCHRVNQSGADVVPLSARPAGDLTDVNTPTIFNAALNFRLFWNGSLASLESHIRQPMLADSATSWVEVLAKLTQDETVKAEFFAIYSQGISIANIQDAIVAYERSLITPNSAFDRFLRGDHTAISSRAEHGYELFKSYGCVACHQGANVGGNMFQKFGVMGDYFVDRGEIRPSDLGRFNVTGRDEDRYVFRVPSLRLAVLTAPYLHDGRAKTLRDAIQVMATYQLGRDIPKDDIELIIEFLKTLPGEHDSRPLISPPGVSSVEASQL